MAKAKASTRKAKAPARKAKAPARKAKAPAPKAKAPTPKPKDADGGEDEEASGSCGRGKAMGRGRGRGKGGKGQTRVGKKVKDKLEAEKKAIQVASEHHGFQLHIRYGSSTTALPSTFIRIASSIIGDTTLLPIKPHPDNCLSIVVTSEAGRGTTGIAHAGTLKVPIAGTSKVSTLKVVVKLAHSIYQRGALKKEYEMYRLLRSKGVLEGIATVLGIFDSWESANGPSALLMLNSGLALDKQPSMQLLSPAQHQSALSTLKSIHGAGILHNSVHPRNILLGDSGITIIDFGGSELSDYQARRDNECNQLALYMTGH